MRSVLRKDEEQMGKQQKLKAQRRAARKAAAATSVSWQDDEGIHFVAPGTPKPGSEEKLTKDFQEQIKNSPLWPQMVAEFGEERALELLKECKAEIKK